MNLQNDHKSELGQLDLLKSVIDEEPIDIDTKNENAEKSSLKSLKSKDLSSHSKFEPRIILILDTETTGLDEEKDSCIEVGSILYDVNSRSVLAQQSFLLPVDSNNAEKINRIPAQITKLSQPLKEAIEYFKSLVNASDAIVAHNAAFDRKWFGLGLLPEINKPWICSMEDISWPEEKQLRGRPSVRDLAIAYGVPVWNAHRALTDCIYLAEVFSRCNDLEMLLLYGLEPRKLMRANISYEQRHLAKEAGFRWNDAVRGAWTRRLSNREILDLDFPVIAVESLG